MVTTNYKIIEGSIKKVDTKHKSVSLVSMRAIPMQTVTSSKFVKAYDISFKWNPNSGLMVAHDKICAALDVALDTEVEQAVTDDISMFLAE